MGHGSGAGTDGFSVAAGAERRQGARRRGRLRLLRARASCRRRTWPPPRSRRSCASTGASTSSSHPLGSQQDQNFLARAAGGAAVGVVKITNPAFTAAELAAQDAAAAAHRARARPTCASRPRRRMPPAAPRSSWPTRARAARASGSSSTCTAARSPATPTSRRRSSPAWASSPRVRASRSRTSTTPASTACCSGTRASPTASSTSSPPITPTPARRAQVTDAAAAAWAALGAVAADLPVQAVHLDLTDDNVVCTTEHGVRMPDGMIDFGDVTRTWAVAELAITISSVLHHAGAEPVSVLPAVRAFHALRPLSPAEVAALWPLVVLRAAVLVVSGEHQVQLDGGDNAYAASGIEREWRIFEQAVSVPSQVMSGRRSRRRSGSAPAVAARRGRPSDGDAAPVSLAPGPGCRRGSRGSTCRSPPTTSTPGRGSRPDLEDDLARARARSWRGAPRCCPGARRDSRPRASARRNHPPTVPTGIDVWFARTAAPDEPSAGEVAAAGTADLAVVLDDGLRLDLEGRRRRARPAVANTAGRRRRARRRGIRCADPRCDCSERMPRPCRTSCDPSTRRAGSRSPPIPAPLLGPRRSRTGSRHPASTPHPRRRGGPHRAPEREPSPRCRSTTTTRRPASSAAGASTSSTPTGASTSTWSTT